MDKQTAIDLLDNLLGMVEDNHESDYDTAIKMGIDALKMQLSDEDATKDATFDYISRQAAIDALKNRWKKTRNYEGIGDDIAEECELYLKQVPSVEELKSEAWDTAYLEGYTAGQNAQPKYVALHESCTDCPLYDRKNYNCPRFNRVIPMAIRDAQTQVKALSLPSVQPEQIARDISTIIENEKDMRVILNAPSAQSEIIRCKDCMHNGSYDTDCPIDWNGKEYCSFAERKEDE